MPFRHRAAGARQADEGTETMPGSRQIAASAPAPAMTNIGRQPKVGMIAVPRTAVAGNPATTTKAMKASHLPRVRGGANSVIVE